MNFLDLCREGWHCASGCQAALGSPGLDSTAEGNWTQECTDRNMHQDGRQDKKQEEAGHG